MCDPLGDGVKEEREIIAGFLLQSWGWDSENWISGAVERVYRPCGYLLIWKEWPFGQQGVPVGVGVLKKATGTGRKFSRGRSVRFAGDGIGNQGRMA